MPSSHPRARLERVENAVSGFLKTQADARPRVLVAASGGCDSTALLAACAAVAPSTGIEAVAVWVDHAIRPEAEIDAERRALGSTCAAIGVRLLEKRLGRGAVSALAAAGSCGVEAAARSLRRAALAEAARAEGASLVLLGHTRDDQAETVLMRLFSGSGSGGLRGMRSRNGLWGRPLLSLPKSALAAYLEERGLIWSEDSTNAELDYARNRARHVLIPALDAVFPGWRKAIARTAAKAALEDEALEALAPEAEWTRSGDRWTCESSRFEGTALALAVRMLARGSDLALASTDGPDGARLPWNTLASAAKGAADGKPFRSRGGGLLLESDGRRVSIRFQGGRAEDAGTRERILRVRVDEPGPIVVGKREVLRIYWTDGGEAGLPEGSFSFPLTLRTRRPGDPGHPVGDGAPDPEGFPLLVAEDEAGLACLVGAPAGRRDFPRSARPTGGRRLVIAKGTDASVWH